MACVRATSCSVSDGHSVNQICGKWIVCDMPSRAAEAIGPRRYGVWARPGSTRNLGGSNVQGQYLYLIWTSKQYLGDCYRRILWVRQSPELLGYERRCRKSWEAARATKVF